MQNVATFLFRFIKWSWHIGACAFSALFHEVSSRNLPSPPICEAVHPEDLEDLLSLLIGKGGDVGRQVGRDQETGHSSCSVAILTLEPATINAGEASSRAFVSKGISGQVKEGTTTGPGAVKKCYPCTENKV
ncbi:MAG: hypothetical protein RI601_00335 [Desulfurivibrionaceae bacterium]|nr:hypothetical protein [Desulfurivibrionaceae bacterium]